MNIEPLHYTIAGVVLAVILYIPLIKGILKDNTEQSCATWMLWVSLDLIAMASLIVKGGNYHTLIIYVVGGSTIVAVLLYTKQFKWSFFEWIVLALVMFCLIIWKVSGPRAATISSTIAVVLAGLPQLKDSWLKPDRTVAWLYFGFLFVNLFYLLAGKEWSIEERFYPACCIPLCATVMFAAFRKPKVI